MHTSSTTSLRREPTPAGIRTPHAYPAGTGFVDPGGADVHALRNEGSVPAETIAVQFLPKDAARKIDVLTAPANCHV
jgi:hypothetical protein